MAVVLPVLFGACNDTPTTIGSDYVPTNVEFHRITLQADRIVSDLAAVSSSSSAGASTILVGHAADGTTAHGLMVVSGIPTFPSDPGPVVGAEILMAPAGYRYPGTASDQGSFDVVSLNDVFGDNATWNDVLVAEINGGTTLGTFSGSVTDTTQRLAIPLNAAEATKFLQSYYRYDTVRSSVNGVADSVIETHILKTIAFRAHTQSGGNIVSFLGATFLSRPDSLKPVLQVRYADTTIQLAIGVSDWIASTPVQVGENMFKAAGGSSARTYMHFNVDSIPTSATIHEAELDFYVDTAQSTAGTFGSSNFLVAYAGDANTLSSGSRMVSSYTGIFTANRQALDSTSFTNKFRITSFPSLIANWLRFKRGVGGIENDGIIIAFNRSSLRTDMETGSVDRFTFYGNDAVKPELRPTLTITYSVQTDAKN